VASLNHHLKYIYLPDSKPPIHEITGGPDGLNTSLKSFYDVIVSDEPKTQELLSYSNSWVDVRDTALGHVLALQKEAAAGERIIICSGMGDFPSSIKFLLFDPTLTSVTQAHTIGKNCVRSPFLLSQRTTKLTTILPFFLF
jgi:hypothetical protein